MFLCWCDPLNRLTVMGPLTFMPYLLRPRNTITDKEVRTHSSALHPDDSNTNSWRVSVAAGSLSGWGASLRFLRVFTAQIETLSLCDCLTGLTGCLRSLLKCLIWFANICDVRIKLSQTTQSTNKSPGQRICRKYTGIWTFGWLVSNHH